MGLGEKPVLGRKRLVWGGNEMQGMQVHERKDNDAGNNE